MIRYVLCLALLAATGVSAAETGAIDIHALAANEAKRYPQPVLVGSLIGRDVVKPVEAQPVIGHVAGFAHRPDGGVDMIIQYGGLFGIFSRQIAVPLEAMALLGPYAAALDFTPEQLDQFPTVTPPQATKLAAGDTIRMALTRPFH
jgi:hypothetical protein